MMLYFSTYLDNLQLVYEEKALSGHSVFPFRVFLKDIHAAFIHTQPFYNITVYFMAPFNKLFPLSFCQS